GGDADRVVRHRDVELVLIGCRSPFHSAQLAATPYPYLPKDLSPVVRIERSHHAGLLGADQGAPASRKIDKDGGGAVVEVGAIGLRAIGLDGSTAGHVVRIARSGLTRPRQ